MSGPVGVLVMAHGTPAGEEQLEAFYTRIRRGRPPSAAQLAELAARYRAIGGVSPLNRITAAQVAALARELERRRPGAFAVRFGAKHAEPFIEDGASALTAQHPSSVVALVLTPQRSTLGTDEYLARAKAALAPLPVTPVTSWYDHPGFVAAVADRLRRALDALGGPAAVVFTAHSLPVRIRELGDPYEDEVAASAALVARAAGVEDYQVAWQSAGLTNEAWLGPALGEVLAALGAEGTSQVVVCPVGFVADHLEVLYDLDVEAKAVAERAGLRLTRTASLNDDPRLAAALADVVLAASGHRGELG